jgi:hypothetical protein
VKLELTEAEFFALWEHLKGSPLRAWLEGAAPAAPPTPAPVQKAAPVPVPEPTSDLIEKHLNSLGKLSPEQDAAAMETFATFLQAWLLGWEMPNAPQPGDIPGTLDRVKLMENLGAGAHARHILILAFQRLSLQQLVIDALVRFGWHPPFDEQEANLNWIERLAGHLVQLAAPCGFPELVDTYDYTTRWRRTT